LTDKPAAWLILSKDEIAGQLTVWSSGEAEMQCGTLEHLDARHYDACVSDLEDALRLT